MPMPISPLAKIHPTLFHYTTGQGLEGILRSKTLWATHFAYLNDSMEFRVFRNPLEEFLRPVVRENVEKLANIPNNKILIQEEGGLDAAAARIAKDATGAMYDVLFGTPSDASYTEPYVLSFCTAPVGTKEEASGLLSQWRGYGKDGGYALAFDTDGIESLIVKEGLRWEYDHIVGGDVVLFVRTGEPISRGVRG